MYKSCKYTSYCKYSHDIFYKTDKHIEKKITALENVVSGLKSCLEESLCKIESLENYMKKQDTLNIDLRKKVHDEQTDKFENMNNILEKKVFEKIENLEKNLSEKADTKDTEIQNMISNKPHEASENSNTILKEKIDSLEIIMKKKDDQIKNLEEGMGFLIYHFKSQHDIDIYPRDYCEKCKRKIRLPSNFTMEMHLQEVHRIFKCKDCEFIAESDRARKYHVKSNHKIWFIFTVNDCNWREF